MKRSFLENITVQLLFLSAVVLLPRIPFLWAGFGAEEDSWLLALTAKNMALSGNYEMSRAPGHPLQEYLYAFLYNNGLNPFYTNLISAISSVIATLFFALSLRNLNFKHYLFAAFAFAFTPIVFISSTYTIDYMLAMAFVMGSFYFITQPAVYPPLEGVSRGSARDGGGLAIAGLMLGLSIGFRLTSAAMFLPFCILLLPLSQGGLRRVLIFGGVTVSVGLLTYIPVLKTYGLSFFHYSDQFPYPNFPKLIYKSTLGVFGMVGLLAIIYFKAGAFFNRSLLRNKMIPAGIPKHLFLASLIAILLYIASYLRLPQKSAYLIPLVPFLILLFGYYLSSLQFRILCVLLTLSSFLFSMNLTDPLRGSARSSLATTFTLAGQEVFIDPLSGPIFSDYTKRLNKIAYTEKVFDKIQNEQGKIVLISGWWYNELLVRSWGTLPKNNVIPVFYIDRPTMERYLAEGYSICYLPEQNLYNDQYSQMSFTDTVAKPYMHTHAE